MLRWEKWRRAACPQLGMKISLVACRMLEVEIPCAGLCVFSVEPPTLSPISKASHLMSKSSISQGLVKPGANPLALHTDPAWTLNVLKCMFAGSASQKKKKTLPLVYPWV